MRKVAAIAVVLTLALLAAAATWLKRPTSAASRPARAARTLVASIRTEPRSFNRYAARDSTTEVITFLTQSALVRVDRVSGRLGPELAERWDLLPDGVTYRVVLREGVRFSDGTPFSADDVVFSFRAMYDERGGSVLADSLMVRGQPLTVTVENPRTVLIKLPSPFGPGLRLLDGVPMLPRHRLEQPLDTSGLASIWGAATPPRELVGLGPFTLQRYDSGERLVFDRNPQYWRRENGQPLPALDRVVLEIVPDQDAELLRLQSGEIDCTQSELRPSDDAALRRAAGGVPIRVVDLGVGLDGDLLWFNLTAAKARDPRSGWLQDVRFRRGVSLAVDRQAFVDTVYLGSAVAATGLVSPGNKEWYVDTGAIAHDPAAARDLFASVGLTDRHRDGRLVDARRAPARFTLLTQKGNTSLERGASVVRDALAAVGVGVDVVALEAGALVHRLMRGDYDAAYFRLLTTDADPALNPDFWLSSGSAHVWNPAQAKPSTPWESAVDALMEEVATSGDQVRRKAAFGDVQRIMARELPALCYAFPRLRYAMSARIRSATPAAMRPPILWNPAAIRMVDVGEP
jgi:peptide/nickel transport system substrate-binding protein